VVPRGVTTTTVPPGEVVYEPPAVVEEPAVSVGMVALAPLRGGAQLCGRKRPRDHSRSPLLPVLWTVPCVHPKRQRQGPRLVQARALRFRHSHGLNRASIRSTHQAQAAASHRAMRLRQRCVILRTSRAARRSARKAVSAVIPSRDGWKYAWPAYSGSGWPKGFQGFQ